MSNKARRLTPIPAISEDWLAVLLGLGLVALVSARIVSNIPW